MRSRGIFRLGGPRHTFQVRGEAAFVDLGANRHVIGIMAHGAKAEDVDRIISLVMETYGYYKWEEAAWAHRANMLGPAELKPPLIPTLVTFSDPTDPRSAKVVYATDVLETNDGRTGPKRYPRVAVDRLAELFGPGVRFKRAWLETTTEPLSARVEERMPEIIRQLREEARVFRTRMVGAPYTAGLGHFIRG